MLVKCILFYILAEMAIIVQASDLIARLDLDDPSSVRNDEPFHGTFPIHGPPTAISGKVHQKFSASMNSARMILAGYEHNINQVRHSNHSDYSYSSNFVSPCLPCCYCACRQRETNLLVRN
jgi:hypothetical protein